MTPDPLVCRCGGEGRIDKVGPHTLRIGHVNGGHAGHQFTLARAAAEGRASVQDPRPQREGRDAGVPQLAEDRLPVRSADAAGSNPAPGVRPSQVRTTDRDAARDGTVSARSRTERARSASGTVARHP